MTVSNSTNGTNGSCEQHEISLELITSGKVLVSVCYIFIFLLGFTGNLLVILTLAQHRSMRTGTNILLLNLAVADLLIVCFIMPDMLVNYLVETYLFPNFICKTMAYIQAASVAASVFTLVVLTLERYFAIVHPFWARQWQTRQHTLVSLAVIWLLSLIIPIPVLLTTKTFFHCRTGSTYCTEIWHPKVDVKKAYSLVSLILLHSGPLLLMVLCYGRIGCVLLSRSSATTNRRRDRRSPSDESCIQLKSMNGGATRPAADDEDNRVNSVTSRKIMQQTNRRVLPMLILVVLEFFLCWTPVFISNTWATFGRASAMAAISRDIRVIITLVSYLSTCCNPITYCFLNKNFRRCFIKALTRPCKKEGPFQLDARRATRTSVFRSSPRNRRRTRS